MRHSPPPLPNYKISDPINSPVSKFIDFDFSKMDVGAIYRLLIGSVVPRPIAWVSSMNSQGQSNLAPFSFFNAISSDPPCLIFSPTYKAGGKEKDTLLNIRETGEFVVNSVSEWVVEPMHQSSAEYDSSIDEMKKLNLTPIASSKVRPFRIKESPIQFECVLEKIIPIGEAKVGATNLVIGRIVMMHIWDEAISDGKILIEKIKPVARLGGRSYGRVDDLFELWNADAKIDGKSTLD
ncbi:MAG: flavin reductase family protein, partial [Bdellovibrionota bacterium]